MQNNIKPLFILIMIITTTITRYKDADSVMHNVYFTDAATNFNTIRFADEYGTAGTALLENGQ